MDACRRSPTRRREMMSRGLVAAITAIALLAACSSSNGDDRGAQPRREESAPASTATPSPEAEETAGVTTVSLADQLEAELDIGDEPDWMTSGYGSIWVQRAHGSAVDRIDPATNEVVASIKVGANPCNGMAAGFDSVWVPSCTKQALYRISAETENVEAVVKVPVYKSFTGTPPYALGGIDVGAGAV